MEVKPIDPAFEFLLAWEYINFFELPIRPNMHDWECKGCREIVKQWEREKHFNAHVEARAQILREAGELASFNAHNASGDTRIDKCIECGNEFSQIRKRGRPRKSCFSCKPDEVIAIEYKEEGVIENA